MGYSRCPRVPDYTIKLFHSAPVINLSSSNRPYCLARLLSFKCFRPMYLIVTTPRFSIFSMHTSFRYLQPHSTPPTHTASYSSSHSLFDVNSNHPVRKQVSWTAHRSHSNLYL